MTRAFPLKVISLAVALLLTYAVRSGQNSSVVSLFVPIELKNLPDDKAVVKPVRRGVQVTLKGPSFLIGPVASSPPAMRVKLPDTESDSVTVSFQPTDIALPSSVEVLSIEPSQMQFVFEQLERHDLKVEVPKVGKLPQGLVLQGIEVVPKFVTVRGAQSDISKLKVMESEPVDLSKVDESTEVTLGLRVAGVSVTPSAKSVTARISVGQQPTEKVFSARPIELRLTSSVEALTLKPEKVSVTVSGPPGTIAKLEGQEIVPFVKVSGGLSSAVETMKVEIDAPAGLTVVSVDPASVDIKPRVVASTKIQVKHR